MENTRGRGDNVADIDTGGHILEDAQTDFNYIVTYGCPPSDGTPAKSTISLAYFQRLKREAEGWTGEVTLPNALTTWQGTDGKAETFPKI